MPWLDSQTGCVVVATPTPLSLAFDGRTQFFLSSFSFQIIQDLIRQVISFCCFRSLFAIFFPFAIARFSPMCLIWAVDGEANGKCVENYNSLMVASRRRAINGLAENENFPRRNSSGEDCIGREATVPFIVLMLLLSFSSFAIKDSNHKQALITVRSFLFADKFLRRVQSTLSGLSHPTMAWTICLLLRYEFYHPPVNGVLCIVYALLLG